MALELADAFKILADALERLRIPFLIGGSVASSARSIPRSTMDVDIVARIVPAQATPLAAALGRDWYADPDQMREAIRAGRSFNVIFIPRGYKIDIFPATTEFHAAQLLRAGRIPLPFLGIEDEYPVASAEDILLAKLQWYRDGGKVSERQWNDITGLLAVNQDLNFEYLDSWAARLGVADLLAKACTDVQDDS